MPTSSNQVKPFYYVLVGLWLVLIVSSFVYLVQQRLVEFDSEFKLLNTPITTMLEELSNTQTSSLKQTVFHFYDSQCSCTVLTKEHKEFIDSIAINDNFNIVNIDVTDNNIADFIPATPAILITDSNENLLYVGPYSTGLDCSADNSLVDVVLSNYRQGFSSPVVTSDATGCYCPR